MRHFLILGALLLCADLHAWEPKNKDTNAPFQIFQSSTSDLDLAGSAKVSTKQVQGNVYKFAFDVVGTGNLTFDVEHTTCPACQVHITSQVVVRGGTSKSYWVDGGLRNPRFFLQTLTPPATAFLDIEYLFDPQRMSTNTTYSLRQ